MINNLVLVIEAFRPPLTSKQVSTAGAHRKSTKRIVVSVGSMVSPNTVVIVQEPDDHDLDNAGERIILGHDGQIVDDGIWRFSSLRYSVGS